MVESNPVELNESTFLRASPALKLTTDVPGQDSWKKNIFDSTFHTVSLSVGKAHTSDFAGFSLSEEGKARLAYV